jgi:cysteine desulfurase
VTAYLDHAASTPLRAEAREAWLTASETIGNPSSIHHAGQAARRVLEESRERLAQTLGCDPIEVVLTSGGTESVNLGITGLWRAAGPDAAIVMPLGEHHATMDTVAWLASHERAVVRQVPLDRVGRIAPDEWAEALVAPAVATALVANNEIGTIQPAAALARAAADAGVPLHLDAVGAFGHIPLSFRDLRADAVGPSGLCALSVSAHKIGGPIGVGALVVARQAALAPLLHGGGQQRGLRSGTQDAAGAAAFAVAAEHAVAEREVEAARLTDLGDRLIRGIRTEIPDAELLGDPVDRIPGNVHVLFPGAGGEQLLFLLDRAGIAVSTGSACQAGVPEPSHVVLALGRTEREARQVLRITLGRTSTAAEVDALIAALPDAVTRARGR